MPDKIPTTKQKIETEPKTDTNQLPATEAPVTQAPAVYATVADVMAYKRPEPLAEDFAVAELGGAVRIEGIGKYDVVTAVYEEIDNLQARAKAGHLKPVSPVTGEKFTPSDVDIKCCVWCAACVKSPALSTYQWMTHLPSLRGPISLLCYRSLLMSHMIEEKKEAEEAEAEKEAAESKEGTSHASDRED